MAMVEISAFEASKPMPLAEIASRSNISLSYLEQLIAALRRHGLVMSHRGPGGGYMLAREAADIRIADILHAAEDSVPARRQTTNSSTINEQTQALWSNIGEILYASLSRVSLADVIGQKFRENPCIAKMFDSLR
jgi:Rrf2 family iron-sulfur cluster assembly transcriptional regulator